MSQDRYTELPERKVAAVVTFLEMTDPPELRMPVPPPRVSLRAVKDPDPVAYRELFRLVGGDWLWFSRLKLTDDALLAILKDPNVDFFILDRDGEPKGILELDRRQPPDIELAFFGIARDLIGQGAGRFLMQSALEKVWTHKPRRFHLHTCTLDHPRALEFYTSFGFKAYKRAIEVADDPRLTGLLPRTAASHIPLIGKPE